MVEFAAGAQGGENDLNRGDFLRWVDAHGNSAAVVGDGGRAVRVDLDEDILAEPRQGLVDGIVHDFIDQVMQALDVISADVHPRTGADVLDVVEHPDHPFVVFTVGSAGGFGYVFLSHP